MLVLVLSCYFIFLLRIVLYGTYGSPGSPCSQAFFLFHRELSFYRLPCDFSKHCPLPLSFTVMLAPGLRSFLSLKISLHNLLGSVRSFLVSSFVLFSLRVPFYDLQEVKSRSAFSTEPVPFVCLCGDRRS